jgi:hypothetical protein
MTFMIRGLHDNAEEPMIRCRMTPMTLRLTFTPQRPEGSPSAIRRRCCLGMVFLPGAGAARIASLSSESTAKGYNPNLWFSNVETIAARICKETVTYVANIAQYCMAFADSYQNNLQRRLEIKAVESTAKN